MWIPYEGGALVITINHNFPAALLYEKVGNALTNQSKCDFLYKLMKKYGWIDTACLEWGFKTIVLK